MFADFWNDYLSFYKQPFKSDMSVSGWFLFVGLMIVLLFAWGLILAEFAAIVKTMEDI
jgi:hypothetical protein